MKTRLLQRVRYWVGIWIFSFPLFGLGQIPQIEAFTASVQDAQVYLNWVVKAGSTCNGTEVLRSGNGIDFVEIGRFEGVCGGATEPQSYFFTDFHPHLNQRNYYVLRSEDRAISDTLRLEVMDLPEGGVLVFPSPVGADSRLYFSNPERESVRVMFFGANGQELGVLTTRESFVEGWAELPAQGWIGFRVVGESGADLGRGRCWRE